MADLDLVSTDEILVELSKRCDFVVIVMRRVGAVAPGTDSMRRHWHGDAHTCLGLCADVSAHIITHIMHNSQRHPDSGEP